MPGPPAHNGEAMTEKLTDEYLTANRDSLSTHQIRELVAVVCDHPKRGYISAWWRALVERLIDEHAELKTERDALAKLLGKMTCTDAVYGRIFGVLSDTPMDVNTVDDMAHDATCLDPQSLH